jgi:hypothetical protein
LAIGKGRKNVWADFGINRCGSSDFLFSFLWDFEELTSFLEEEEEKRKKKKMTCPSPMPMWSPAVAAGLFPDALCPFKTTLPAGHSKFVVRVPRHFSDRLFSLSECNIVPDYYSQQAAHANLDTEEELESEKMFEMYITAQIPVDLYGDKYTQNTATNMVSAFVKEVNTFFETKKPAGMTSPFFFDWISKKRLAQEEKTDWPAWITSNAALYYDDVFSETRHGNALPPSVKTVQDATNYAYPTTLVASYLEEIRVRMTLAPNTKVTFSAGKQLASMGFSDAQIGERQGKKQFVFENSSMTDYLTIQAEGPPIGRLLVTTLSVGIYPAFENVVSPMQQFVVTQKQLRARPEHGEGYPGHISTP